MDVLGAAYGANDITWWDLTEYLPDGSLESSVLDTQMDPYWDYLGWNSLAPPGTSVSFQVRASNDYSNMGAWSDTLTSPCTLSGILNDGEQYVQYRAILRTFDPDSTPTLNDVTISWNPVSIEETAEPVPPDAGLLPVSPNPASAPTVRFGLPEPASVELSVFDLSGRLVSKILRDEYTAGYHAVLLNDLSPGIYFCWMVSGDFTGSERFVVIE